MNKTFMLIVIIALVTAVGVLAYNYLTEPRPLTERIGAASTELVDGHVNDAVEEMNAPTHGAELNNTLQEMTQPSSSNSF